MSTFIKNELKEGTVVNIPISLTKKNKKGIEDEGNEDEGNEGHSP